mmetsp:Transcript_10804/g.18113  ORF Transcript_10804/g.18113 Transcript_10804/m.18113 type:complete len:513 (-) Transcript_10804:256-1794(-)|eukprot:CAMPEP_0119318436 /NCGR_PEP_ID=MMETSP1333-20130426/46392_1 /TAXON_ID=418940 /ORGANISM="Scyphosphaera apsteinii, Strain RCC1455" /LENGTH=512 /DNA_ID=CAMNT_0007324609 /DNA_START=104 /DNA_END=1642 /DNA_ORIENTATION=+
MRWSCRSEWRIRQSDEYSCTAWPTEVAEACKVVEEQLGSAALSQGVAPHVGKCLIRLCMNALEGLGGLEQLIEAVVSGHAALRKKVRDNQQILPAGLDQPLSGPAAAAAVLRKVASDVLLRLQFGGSGQQDGEVRSCEVAWHSASPQARNMASAVLDHEAFATLSQERCIVRHDFLSPDAAADLHAEFCALDQQGLFQRCRNSVNMAVGRQFFNMTADEARRMGAHTVALTIEALAAMTLLLTDAAATDSGSDDNDRTGSLRQGRAARGFTYGAAASQFATGSAPLPCAAASSPAAATNAPAGEILRPWWKTAEAPMNAVLQMYPPGARYDVHTDTHYTGDGFVSHRSFTAIVYAHEGWTAQHGGELDIYHDAESARLQHKVQPRCGTLVLFPAHLHHAVAPVCLQKRYCITFWIALKERRPTGAAARVAAELSSTSWIDVFLKFGETYGVPPPPGTIIANQTVGLFRERACRNVIAKDREDNHSDSNRRVCKAALQDKSLIERGAMCGGII